MQPTVFRYDRYKTRRFDFAALAFCLLFGLISLRDFIVDLSDLGMVSWFDLVAAVMFGVIAILFLARIAGLGFLGGGWNRVRLSLDDEGLTYIRGGLMRTLKISWAELSDIEYEGPAFLRKSSILFRRDAAGLMDRLTMDLTISGPRVRLPDIFDSPPKDICAKLNEYRDRALGGAGAKAPG